MKRAVLLLLVGLSASALASDIVEVLPLTDRIVMVHFDDGYVVHHGLGQKRSDEKVVVDPLDEKRAASPTSYGFTIGKSKAVRPVWVGRKSKGTDFAWFTDRWENGMAINDRPDHAKEHWIYLALQKPLLPGQKVLLNTPLAKDRRTRSFTFDPRTVRSDAVHVNVLGYVPDAPKFAYLSEWMGDRGGLDLSAYRGKRFWIVDASSAKPVFEGRVALRKPGSNPETAHLENALRTGNFIGADVYECDFSAFRKSGTYRVAVEGVGGSFPFKIDADALRPAFTTVARGLYHNRSGIELKRPYTEFTRPAPHHPELTPGWKGKLFYSSLRSLDYGNESSDRKTLEPTLKGTLDAWGWYQDAGDWDSYSSHMRVPTELLFAYEINPKAFRDRDLNIPESGNGVPDILDEAAWLPRFGHRLRQELLAKKFGTGGIGLRVAGDAFGGDGEGKPSWKDTDRIYVASGEDPVSTFRHAGAAAHLAHCLRLAGTKDPEGVDWVKEARESYDWAIKNTLPKDENEVRPHRAYAAAALFRVSRDASHHSRFAEDFATMSAKAPLWEADHYGAAIFAVTAEADSELRTKVREALFKAGDAACESADKRAMRWAGNWWFPMVVGQQTTPLCLEVATAMHAARGNDAARAKRYYDALHTTADYFLGGNSLNTTWVTGLGPVHPQHVFHMDAWYNGKGKMHPGIIPYGPWLREKEFGPGPWDVAWPHKTVYPAIDQWPGNERWFDNRCSPLNSEFTVHQNAGPAAAIYGILCGERK